MITIINCHNAHLFSAELDQMFRLRHKVLVEQEEWSELDSEDKFEQDAFDDGFTTYLVCKFKEAGPVIGCVRFTPSIRPSMSSVEFPQLFDLKGLPTGPLFYDGSRILVDPDTQKKGTPTQTATELYCGMFEFGAALGLRGITCVVAMKWLEYMRHWGWDIAPLGLPEKMGEGSVIGLEIHPTPEMVTQIRKVRQHQDPVLSKAGIGLIRANHRLIHGLSIEEQSAA